MKSVKDFKKEFEQIKNEISFLIDKLNLKLTVEEILNFTSIAFSNFNLNLNEEQLKKQDYKILGNLTYKEIGTSTKKQTRINLLSLKKSKILKMKDEEIFEIFFDYTKLISFFNRYKILRQELDNLIILKFPEIETYFWLTPIFGISEIEKKVKEILTPSYIEFSNLKKSLEDKEEEAYYNISLKTTLRLNAKEKKIKSI